MNTCIKCGKKVKEIDSYCKDCETKKQRVAAEIDKKFVRRSPSPTLLDKYNQAPKVRGFPRASDVL